MTIIESNLFKKANAYYQQGNYVEALDLYQNLYRENPAFEPYAVNLALLIRKVDFSTKRDGVLHTIFQTHYDLPLETARALIAASKLFDDKWYAENYVDWLPLGLEDFVLHYISLGWRLGFNPGPSFDTNEYIRRFYSSRSLPLCPLLHYLNQEGTKEIEEGSSSWLSDQLWGGYSNEALQKLETLAKNTSESKEKCWWALWHQARWYYFDGDFERALDLAEQMQALLPGNRNRKEGIYLQFFCLCSLGRSSDAYTVLAEYVKLYPQDIDALLAWSNAVSTDTERLDLINQAFALAGLVGVELKDPLKPLTFANIKGKSISSRVGKHKVSIIMPIYKAAEQVQIAIDSLLSQSYENLEIIAVDDCSPDHTFNVLQALAEKDPRIKAVQMGTNSGAYAARNFGLGLASGDLITTHDSDDWSHPEKIAIQVEYLEANPKVMGCAAHWARAEFDLRFTQNWRPGNSLAHWSHSSFMFRKEVVKAIGVWDLVRIGGDTEYIWRMQAQFGQNSFKKIRSDIPLAFALDEESSLTRTKSTHVRTVYFGLRHIYREIAAWWQRYQLESMSTTSNQARAFNVPMPMISNDGQIRQYDQVLAGDFSCLEDTLRVAKVIEKSTGQSIALFHWPQFGRVAQPLCNLYFELLRRPKIEPIVVGQKVQASAYYLADQNLKTHALDMYPEWVGFDKWCTLA